MGGERVHLTFSIYVKPMLCPSCSIIKLGHFKVAALLVQFFSSLEEQKL